MVSRELRRAYPLFIAILFSLLPSFHHYPLFITILFSSLVSSTTLESLLISQGVKNRASNYFTFPRGRSHLNTPTCIEESAPCLFLYRGAVGILVLVHLSKTPLQNRSILVWEAWAPLSVFTAIPNRDVRTHTLHDPVAYKNRELGEYVLLDKGCSIPVIVSLYSADSSR